MNDRRFIELLNLYVDQELSPEQARELEQEIAHRPERRRIYSQYCRMQRACVRLIEQQEAPAPRMADLKTAATGTASAAPVSVIHLPSDEAFHSAHRGRRGLVWMTWGSGLVATAACVALAFVLLRQPNGPAGTPVSTPQVATTQPAASDLATNTPVLAAHTAAPMSAAPERESDYQSVLRFTNFQRGVSEQLVVTPPTRLGQTSLEWLLERRLTPIRRLPLESFPYDTHNSLSNESGPMFVNDRVDGSIPTESITFEFRR